MTVDREAMFREMVREFPDSPMGHFSLGRFYLDQRRFGEAAASLAEATRLDPDYAAAHVALGDSWAGLGDKAKAREAWQRARETALGRRDVSLQADLDARIRELDEF